MKPLHPDAAAALNAIADTISFDSPPKSPPGSSGSGWGELYVSHRISQKDIVGALRIEVTNGVGEREGIFSALNGKQASITGESLLTLGTLVQRVLGISSLNNLLSTEYVDKLAIDWCLDGSQTRPPFAEFLMRHAEKDVSQHQIWIPTAYLEVEENFQFGPSEIIVIPQTFFDEAERRVTVEKPEDAE